MPMREYPTKRETVFIEDLGREIVIRELTTGYIKNSQTDPEFDTAANAVKLLCGLADEEIDMLGVSTLADIYRDIIDLTYPGMRDLRDKQIAEGSYKKPNDDEVKDTKKN